jgi:hypothetical protein
MKKVAICHLCYCYGFEFIGMKHHAYEHYQNCSKSIFKKELFVSGEVTNATE